MRYVIGVLWLCVGGMLLYKGIGLSMQWLPAALVVGLLKGRFVIAKSAQRALCRMRAQLSPFPKPFYALILVMMGMGYAMRFVPVELRAFVDVAVGAALIRGALVFFIGGKDSPAQSPIPDRAAPKE